MKRAGQEQQWQQRLCHPYDEHHVDETVSARLVALGSPFKSVDQLDRMTEEKPSTVVRIAML